MAKCKGCGRPIIWIMSSGGKMIPCDPTEVLYWKRAKARGKIVTKNGEVVSCDLDAGIMEEPTGIGYVPHWATCPVADRFKRTKEDSHGE